MLIKIKNYLNSKTKSLFLEFSPFKLFKDCTYGSVKQQNESHLYNKKNKNILLPFINRWAQKTVLFFLLTKIYSFSFLFNVKLFISTFFAICFSISFTITLVIIISWIFLSFAETK